MTEEQTLDEYLKTRKPKSNGFKAVPHYFPDGDFISCFASNERCYAKQIGERLTVYYSDKTNEVVGCKIKGVKAIMGRAEVHSTHPFESMAPQGSVE